MSWGIEWAPRARKDMRRLDKQTAERIGRAVERLAETGQGDVRRLQDLEPPEWRLRVGDWRVRFRFRTQEQILEVLRVLHRQNAY